MTFRDSILPKRFTTIFGQVKISSRTVSKHSLGSLVCFVVKLNYVNNNRYLSMLSFHWHTHAALQNTQYTRKLVQTHGSFLGGFNHKTDRVVNIGKLNSAFKEFILISFICMGQSVKSIDQDLIFFHCVCIQ